MSSSFPSSPDDSDIADLLRNIAVTAPSASAMDAANAASLTGEFLALKMGVGGSSLTMEKGVRIVCLEASSLNSICCGYIGVKKASFCLKSKESCPIFQKGGSHTKDAFIPKSDHYYICKNGDEDSAWSEFQLPRRTITGIGIEVATHVESRMSLKEWQLLFDNCNAIDFPSNEDEVKRVKNVFYFPSSLYELKKEKNETGSVKKEGADTSIASSGFKFDETLREISLEEQSNWNSVVPSSLTGYLVEMADGIRTVSETVYRSQKQVTSLVDVGTDLRTLSKELKGMKTAIGIDKEGAYPDLWTGIQEIQASLNGIDLESLEESVQQFGMDAELMKAKLVSNTNHWLELGKNWLPAIRNNTSSIEQLKLNIKKFTQQSSVESSSQQVNFMLQNNLPSSNYNSFQDSIKTNNSHNISNTSEMNKLKDAFNSAIEAL